MPACIKHRERETSDITRWSPSHRKDMRPGTSAWGRLHFETGRKNHATSRYHGLIHPVRHHPRAGRLENGAKP